MDNLFGSKTIVYEKAFPTFIKADESLWVTVEFMTRERGRVEIEIAENQISGLDLLLDNTTEYDITVTITPRK